MQSDNLEEQYAIKFGFKLGKNARETHGKLQTAFGASCMNQASVFEWHKRFKEARESVRDDERCGPQFHPCHRLFDQDGHQDSSSAPL